LNIIMLFIIECHQDHFSKALYMYLCVYIPVNKVMDYGNNETRAKCQIWRSKCFQCNCI